MAKQGPTEVRTVEDVFTVNKLWKWYRSTVTKGFDGVSEKGADYATAFGTPVGIIVGGTVVRMAHFNNSIGDVVEIRGVDNRVYLYQHITSRVRVGQKLVPGDVVGTENGLPRDQYSSGPHIEVRVTQPGTWDPRTDSWLEPWVNPANFFSGAGMFPASGVPASFTGANQTGSPFTGATSPGAAASHTYTSLLDQLHETLINTPGFYGIALTLDEAEQFPGYVDLKTPQPQIAGVSLPDITGEARSIGATITDNFFPFAIRSGLVLIGGILLVALLLKPLSGTAGFLASNPELLA